MNDVLQLLWIDIYDLKFNQAIIDFDWPWLYDKIAAHNIYSIEWFYAKWDCLVWDVLFPLDKDCWNYCTESPYKWLMMYNAWSAYKSLLPCQYTYCIDTKEISFNIPDWITEWYLRYYKWIDIITDQEDYIPVPPSFFPALKMLMKVFYYEKAGSVYEWDDNKFEAKYNTFIQKVRDRDAVKLRFIKTNNNI